MAFLGDEAFMRQMLSMMEETLEKDIPTIRAALDDGDVAGANRLLHAIKGFVPTVCNDVMVDHVTAVEILSKTGSVTEVRDAFGRLLPDLNLLLLEIRAYLADI